MGFIVRVKSEKSFEIPSYHYKEKRDKSIKGLERKRNGKVKKRQLDLAWRYNDT